MPERNAAAVQVVFDNLAALPHEKYGVINMLPFAHDSEQVRMIKRQVSEAVVGLLDTHGFLRVERSDNSQSAPSIAVVCQHCGSALTTLVLKTGQSATVNASAFITAMAGLNPQCPHQVLTLDDLRNSMATRLQAEIDEQEAAQCDE